MIGETKITDVVTNPKIDDEKEKLENKKIISLEILKIIKDAQQQHGLRHSDYQRYRGYCTRRIGRLRKTLHLAQSDKRHYKRKDVTESHLDKDERYLYIPLMMAERAWSYAMQLRQEANTELRKNFHMKSRLLKAASHALQLQALCQNYMCDARTKLEAQGYVAWIQGSLLFELQSWHKAMEHLQQAQMVYSKLIEAVSEEEAILYRHRVEELQPSLRYCAYSIGDQSAMSDLQNMRTSLAQDSLISDKLDALMEEARGKLKSLEEVEWRGKRITVRPESVGSFLAAEQALGTSVTDMDTLERHLGKCRDAIAAVREAMADQAGGGKQGKTTIAPAGGQLLLTYLIHIRLSRTIQRILLIIDKTKEQEAGEGKEGKKPKGQDLIRLYEMILQNLSEQQQLSGMDEDKEYQQAIDDDINWYKAHRCYYMSVVLSSGKHFKEAYAILERAALYASKVAGERAKGLSDNIDTAKHLAIAHTAFQSTAPPQSSSLQDDKKANKNLVPLIDRLDEYVEDPNITSNPNLVHFPPEMQPIAYKPLFFDIAVNHLSLPKLDDKPAKQQQQGISGFVKGLWGGWGSK